ncbi:MAG: hypothetical protein JWO83_4986 [Caulobacteraceae bacterium]|jgi:hypothetical protein|nr:hypothetical protein [Caulobacteraceae bacterium]
MDHLTGFVATILFWTVLAAVILVPTYLRYQDRQRMHETLRIAFEKGQPVPPELITALQTNIAPRRPTTPESDLRRAVIFIALGLGFCGLGYGLWYGLMSVNDIAAYVTGGSVAGIGAIPGLVGVAHLVLWASRRGTTKV